MLKCAHPCLVPNPLPKRRADQWNGSAVWLHIACVYPGPAPSLLQRATSHHVFILAPPLPSCRGPPPTMCLSWPRPFPPAGGHLPPCVYPGPALSLLQGATSHHPPFHMANFKPVSKPVSNRFNTHMANFKPVSKLVSNRFNTGAFTWPLGLCGQLRHVAHVWLSIRCELKWLLRRS